MKKYVYGFFLILTLGMACKKEEINKIEKVQQNSSSKLTADALIGKWAPTYLVKNEKGEYSQINTFAPLPEYEFTAEGKFLIDGKPGADPCGFIGNKYSVKENEIKFSDFKPDPAASCIALFCNGWKIESIQKDTLSLTDCFSTSKYVKIK